MVNTKLGEIGVKHIKEKEYKWSYDRTNSKGEVIFRHDTEEDFNFATTFLDKKNMEYEKRTGGSMLWIHYKDETYSYYPTTGRWAPWTKGGYPNKHYTSKGIEDFYTRFLLAGKPTFKRKTETKKEIKKILEDEQIEYKIKKDTVTLTTKAIPRKDGRGNKKRYTYDYIIGTDKWRSMSADGSYNKTYYQASSIENFIKIIFRPQEELL